MSFKRLSCRSSFLALLTCFTLLLTVMPGNVVPTTSAQSGSCPAGLPPLNPAARSFDDFITQAYQGALGRNPTCTERQNEYDNLEAAYYGGYLLSEARRFVSTLFITQASYDSGGYVQTSAYEARRPMNPYDPNDTTNQAMREAFVTDLYHAFLQREPDTGGLCFWQNEVASGGRRHVLDAFQLSIEFGNLVNGLYPGARPCCFTRCPRGYVFNFETCTCEFDGCYPYSCL